MMRPFLAVMAGMLLGVAGMRRARQLRVHAANHVRWVNLLSHLSLLLQQAAYTLPEALRLAADQPLQPDAWLCALADGITQKRISALPASPVLPGQDADILNRYVPRLLHGALESRVQATEQARDEFVLLMKSAQADAGREAKMWSQLGWTLGAALTLLLL